MEKELQTIPTEKDFNLSKVKLLPKGGIQVNYQISQVVDGDSSVIDRNETCTRDVHPDLLGLFEDLRNIVGRVFNITSFLTFLDAEVVNHNIKDRARAFADELLQKIDVRGISWSGTEDNVGVVITSVFETPNGLKTCINTPRIKIAQISFGFEEQLETIVDAVKAEVYAYLFKGKQAQLSLFGQPGDDMPENEPDAE